MDSCDKTTKVLPKRLRVGLPILVLVNVVLLIISAVRLGSTTHLEGIAPYNALTNQTVSSDSLITACEKIYDAKAWVLLLVTAGFVGIWPYVKLFATLVGVWLVDHGYIRKGRGRDYLENLEAFDKWSYSKIFLICFNLVIFFMITPEYEQPYTHQRLKINLWMQLFSASMSLMLAVAMSTLLTHWAIYELSPPAPRWGSQSDDESLAIQAESGHRETTVPSVVERVCTILSCLSSAGILVVGAFLPFLEVDRKGFLGTLMGEEGKLNLSIFSLADGVKAVAVTSNDAVARSFAYLLLLVALVFPLVELCLLVLAALIVSTSYAASYWCRLGAEWFHSFACVEVLLFAALSIVLDLETVVKFSLGESCEELEPLIDPMRAAVGSGGVAECFVASTRLQVGWLILLAAVPFNHFAWRAGGAGKVAHEDAQSLLLAAAQDGRLPSPKRSSSDKLP